MTSHFERNANKGKKKERMEEYASLNASRACYLTFRGRLTDIHFFDCDCISFSVLSLFCKLIINQLAVLKIPDTIHLYLQAVGFLMQL